ncbi:FAS1 domain-containing protein [Fomes fomentarius]|nr:FAS1 domain-containing protein [Fomes fomentarius]
MLLRLHTVLAVVYGGVLVSALPDPRTASEVEEYLDVRDYDHPNPYAEPDQADARWEWVPDVPQFVFGAQTAEGDEVQEPIQFPLPDDEYRDIPHPRPSHPPLDWPKPPEPPHHPPGPPHEPPHPPGPPHRAPEEPHKPFPGPHRPPSGAPNKTIYQFLEGNPKFSRLFKLVNYTEDITKLLNDSSANVTFFALPDWGFPKPHSPPSRHDDDEWFVSSDGFADILANAEGLIHSNAKPDGDKLKKILQYILSYQILPSNQPTSELAKNLTHPTSLKLSDGSLDGKPLRIRVARGLGPTLSVTLSAAIIGPDLPASNGLIHIVNSPVLPPPSVLQASFILPEIYATFTSALQRVGLTDQLEWSDIHGPVSGSPAVTVFAPTNRAFARLPRRLRRFLFSPFGEKALKKLLQFHIVPEFVLHSNYLHNASKSDAEITEYDVDSSRLYENLDHTPYDIARMMEEQDDMFSSPQHQQSRSFPGAGRLGAKSAGLWPLTAQSSVSENAPNAGPRPRLEQLFPPPPPPNFPHPGKSHAPPPPRFPHPCPHGGPLPPPPDHGHHYPHPRRRSNVVITILRPRRHASTVVTTLHPYRRSNTVTSTRRRHLNEVIILLHLQRLSTVIATLLRHSNIAIIILHLRRRLSTVAIIRRRRHSNMVITALSPRHHSSTVIIILRPRPTTAPTTRRHRRSTVLTLLHRLMTVRIIPQNVSSRTLLANHTLNVYVVQFEHKFPLPGPPSVKGLRHVQYETVIFANGVKVVLPDIPLRNGVIHVVDRLLNPLRVPGGPHHPHEGENPESKAPFWDEEEDEWADWEEWLPRWADEE